jgi:nucleotide-binding universal stress UspA family protein
LGDFGADHRAERFSDLHNVGLRDVMNISSLFIPLDGSDLAENALPAAAFLAQRYGASIILFHVIERGARERIHESRHLTNPEEAECYLQEVAGRCLPAGLKVNLHVHKAASRSVSGSIAEHSREMQPNLIILCAHGSGGARDWLIGNIAQQVIARGSTPVLLLRPEKAPDPGASFLIRSILLPLDGNPDHQAAEEPAEDLAKRCKAALHLATAVPTPGTLAGEHAASGLLLPRSTAALLDLSEEGAREYLLHRMEKFQNTGVETTMEVMRGDPAVEIAHLTRRRQDDLIVLGTHGRAGSAAFWNRSTAARILARIKIPALLIPLP